MNLPFQLQNANASRVIKIPERFAEKNFPLKSAEGFFYRKDENANRCTI